MLPQLRAQIVVPIDGPPMSLRRRADRKGIETAPEMIQGGPEMQAYLISVIRA